VTPSVREGLITARPNGAVSADQTDSRTRSSRQLTWFERLASNLHDDSLESG
jgi:hypothetical protein